MAGKTLCMTTVVGWCTRLLVLAGGSTEVEGDLVVIGVEEKITCAVL